MMKRILWAVGIALALLGQAWAVADFGRAALLTGEANASSDVAQYELSKLYLEGRGVPQDYAKGMRLLRDAAAHNFGPAQSHLGIIYQQGIGLPQDYTEA